MIGNKKMYGLLCGGAIVMVLAAGVIGASPAYAGFTYIDSGDGLTITGYSGSVYDLVIPPEIEGSPVVAVGAWAFYGRTEIISVSIASSVSTVGAYAFAGCTGLASVALPDGVESIDTFAFYYCLSLGSVSIPGSVSSIGTGAFSRCTALSSISVDADNPAYSSADGVLYNKDQSILLQFPAGRQGGFAVPDGVTGIEQGAFACSVYLTSVDLPVTILTIGRGAFVSCTSLTAINVSIEHQLYSSHDGVLYDKSGSVLVLCPPAKSGSFNVPATVTRIADGAFSGCVNLSEISLPTSLTRIGDAAFESCVSLVSMVIPDSVTLIGRGLFYKCTALQSVTIGSGLTVIPSGLIFDTDVLGVFSGCTALESITIPAGISTIGDYAFYGCSALTDMYFLGDAPALGLDVFTGVPSGLSVCYTAGASGFTTPWNGYEAGECYPPCGPGDVCPAGYVCVDGECRLDVCSDESDCPEGYECVAGECQNIDFTYTISNGQATITGYSGIGTHIVIPAVIDGYPVAAIAPKAFMGDTLLTSVVIADSVTVIGDRAFYECTNLESLVIGSGVETIGAGAFYKCVALSSLSIPASVSEIGLIAFARLTGVSAIEVDPGSQYYCSENGVLFDKNKTLLIQYPSGKRADFTIPATVTDVGRYAFAWSSVTSVDIPSSVISIDTWAFYYCRSLTSVSIPDSVVHVDAGAFYACEALKSVYIGSGIAEIGNRAFDACWRLVSVAFAGDAPLLGSDVFARVAEGFMVCRTAQSAGFEGYPWDSYDVQVCACTGHGDCDLGYGCAQGLCVPDAPPAITYGPVPTDRVWIWYGLSQDPENPTPVQPVENAVGWLYEDDFGSCSAARTVSATARYRVAGGSWFDAPVVYWSWIPAFVTHLNEVPPGVYEFEACVSDCAEQAACSGLRYIHVTE